MELAQNKCTTYRAGSPPVTRREIMDLLAQVPGWSLDKGHLARTYELESADACITFFTEVMDLATQEGHFPDISIKESRFFEVQFYTYPAGGLTLNDFIMAAKLNAKGTTA
jgi:4a-hydroxytetrahydrobiopterin dehydratase